MGTPLCVLMIEDSQDDALLIARELRRFGYDLTFERVDTPAAFEAALAEGAWDLVLADYAMPHFDALSALHRLQEKGIDLPFMVVSGNIGEDAAVAVMRAGAHDYVMKNNLARLGPAVQRELQEAQVRLARRRAEREVRRRTAQLEAVRQITLELAAQLNLNDLLQSIAARAIELLDGVAGGLYLCQADRRALEWAVSIGPDQPEVGAVLRRGEGLAGKVWETDGPLIVDDYSAWLGRADMYEGHDWSAIVSVPVWWGGEFLGVLVVHDKAPRAFTPDDAELLSLFASQVAIAIRNAQLYEQARSRIDQLAVVNRVARAVGAILRPDALLETVYQEVTSIFHADAFFIALYDAETDELDFRLQVDEGVREPPERQPLGRGLASVVVDEGQPLLVRNFESEQADLPAPELWGTMKTAMSWLGVPIKIGEQLVGIICVQAYCPYAYGEEEELLLSTIADQVAVAMDNAWLYEETRRRAKDQEIVSRVARALNALDIEGAFPVLAKNLKSLTQCERVSIALLEETGEHFRMAVLESPFPSLEQGVVLPLSATAAAQDLLAGQPHLSPDLGAEREWPAEQALYQSGVRSRINLPLLVGGREIGSLNLGSRRPGPFWEGCLPVLEQVADALAIALENSHLFRAERAQRELAEALEEAAAALTATLDFEQVLDLILEQLGRVVPSDAANIMLIEGDEARVVRWRGYERFGVETFISNLSLCVSDLPNLRRMQQAGEPVFVPDTSLSTDWVPIANQEWLRSYAAAPVVVRGRVIGYLNVDSATPGFFSQAHLGPLRAFADHAAAAIENARLFRAEQQQIRRLAVLAQVARTVATTLQADELLQSVAETIRRHFAYPMVGIFMLDETGESLVLQGYSGISIGPEELTTPWRYRQSVEQGVLGYAARTGQTYVVSDTRDDPYFYNPGEVTILSAMAVPIRDEGQVVGVIGLDSERLGDFDQADQSLVEAVADTVASGLRNVRLYEEARLRADELASALSQLEELDRLKDEFMQNVSHELRTPLSLIRGYAEFLERGELGELKPEQEKPVSVIVRRARMLGDMVDDLTALLEAEALRLRHESVHLDHLIQDMLADFQAQAEAVGLSLRAQIEADLPAVFGDPGHLARMLDNLIGNALKFTPEGGRVTVQVGQEDDQIVLEVSDTGIGISADQLERIFDRFYQVDGSTTRRYGGTGLGLALVKEIVQAHGGGVSVQSVLDQGTTFRVTLPAAGDSLEQEK